MSKAPSQQEVDAMFSDTRHDRNRGVAVASEQRVRPCNFRTAGQLSNESARALNALHETFARNVTRSLGVSLGAGFDMSLFSMEQFSFRDFLGSMRDSGYIVPLRVEPLGATAMLQVDNNLVFPMIDLLLGGAGCATPEAHELTEIDENVIEAVIRLILRQLETTWLALGASIAAERCIKPAQASQLFSSADRMLMLTFNATIAENHGVMNLLLPASFGNVLLRQTSTGPVKLKSRVAYFPKPTLREHVLDCAFAASVELTGLRMAVRELLALTPGSVVKLDVPVKNPSFLTIAGHRMFEAIPVRSGARRAAQLLRPSTQPHRRDVHP